jgi:hypothetical protein
MKTRAPCGCSPTIIGASVKLDLSKAAQSELNSLNAQASSVIGGATNAYASAQAGLDDAMAAGKGIEAAAAELDMTGRDVGDAILAVAANPLTHTALGAVAAAAPPFSTVAAAIGEAALGVAAAAVPVVKALESTWNDIFMSYEEKAARQWGVPVEKARAMIAEDKRRDDLRAVFKENKSAATKALAELRVEAAKGKRGAVKALAALDALMGSDVLFLTSVIRFGCNADVYAIKEEAANTKMVPWMLCDLAREVVADQKRAAGMSQKDFDFFRQLGKVTTDKKGRSTGISLRVLDPSQAPGKSPEERAQLVDVSTGKVLYTGKKALALWPQQFNFLIDPKTRRVDLSKVPGLKEDYLEQFKGSLFKDWTKLSAESEKLAAKKLSAAEAYKVSEKARLKEASKMHDKQLKEHHKGILVTPKGATKPGTFKIDKKHKEKSWLVREDGYPWRERWVPV